ncbi:hypothetical protein CONPUDRAFT_85105, partial [Coniophora puteana RWD-64-598 SS2]
MHGLLTWILLVARVATFLAPVPHSLIILPFQPSPTTIQSNHGTVRVRIDRGAHRVMLENERTSRGRGYGSWEGAIWVYLIVASLHQLHQNLTKLGRGRPTPPTFPPCCRNCGQL